LSTHIGKRKISSKSLILIATIAVLTLYPSAGLLRTSAYSNSLGSNQTTLSNTPAATITLSSSVLQLQSSNYIAFLFRYSETGGVAIASSAPLANGLQSSLIDSGLSSFPHTQPDIHYSILVLQEFANGTVAQILNYHWGAQIVGATNGVGGSVSSPESIVLNLLTNGTRVSVNHESVPYQIPSTSAPSTPNHSNSTSTTLTTQTASESATYTSTWPRTILHTTSTNTANQKAAPARNTYSPAAPNSCYWDFSIYYCWNTVYTWYTQPSEIGEATGSGYMQDVFSYGVNSGSELSIVASSNGGVWSASGSYTQYNQGSSAVTWSNLDCCNNYYANTYFDYQEDQLQGCSNGNCVNYQDYQIWDSAWDGGDESWLNAGSTINDSPGDCVSPSSLSGTYSYSPYSGNSQTTQKTANGFVYSDSITIGSNIVGSSYSAQISDTTYYNHYTTQTITFGTQYTNYYVYTNGIYSGGYTTWPVLFTTNTNAHCGP
jgi:hypothetical protein